MRFMEDFPRTFRDARTSRHSSRVTVNKEKQRTLWVPQFKWLIKSLALNTNSLKLYLLNKFEQFLTYPEQRYAFHA